MKVFLSWSGPVSKQVALAFKQWLPNVIQSLTPWISSIDIESGSRWADALFTELAADQFGIVCVTKSNLTAPWLTFEAGALAKQLTKARVVPFLFDMDGPDLPARHPFTHLNYIVYPPAADNREAIKKLLSDINIHVDSPLSDVQLESALEKHWPDIETSLRAISDEAATSNPNSAVTPKADPDIVLAEILELTRTHARLLASMGEIVQANERDSGVLTAQLRSFYGQLSSTSARMRDIAELETGATLTDDILEEVQAIAASLIAVRRQVRSMGESLGVQVAPQLVFRGRNPRMAGMPQTRTTDGNEDTH